MPPPLLTGPIVGVIVAALAAGDELAARDFLNALSDVARVAPGVFRACLGDAVAAVLNIVMGDGLDVLTRQAALEVVVTIAETGGVMVRKAPAAVDGMVSVALRLMAASAEDPAWAAATYCACGEGDPDADEAGECVAPIGEAAFARLADAIGGNKFTAAVFKLLPGFVSSEAWAQRKAGLIGLALMAPACADVLKESLSGVVAAIVPCISDPHQRVRHAALTAVGGLAGAFSEDAHFQMKYGGAVLPPLAGALASAAGNCERVRAHAAAVLQTYVVADDCTPACLAGGLGPLLDGLLDVLQTCGAEAQEQALLAVAVIARLVRGEFAPYYPGFLGGVREIIMRDVPEGAPAALVELRGRAMECVGMLGDGACCAAQRGLREGRPLALPRARARARARVCTCVCVCVCVCGRQPLAATCSARTRRASWRCCSRTRARATT